MNYVQTLTADSEKHVSLGKNNLIYESGSSVVDSSLLKVISMIEKEDCLKGNRKLNKNDNTWTIE